MNTVKYGVIGLNRGKTLSEKAMYCPNAEIWAICDIDKEKADNVAAQLNIKNVYYNMDEMLAATDIDAVIIATPIPNHTEHVIAALKAGKHVLSEVTAATSMEDCYRLLEAVKLSDKKYMMEENYCYYRPLTIVENMIKAGLFGDVYYAESDYLMDFQQRANFPDGIDEWRKDVYFGRRGHPYITHTLGPLANIMGENIVAVTCMGAGKYPGLIADNTCVLMCYTEKGNMIRLRNSFVSARPDLYTYYSIQGTKGCYQGPQGPTDFHKVHISGLCKPNEWKNLYDFKEFLGTEWDILPNNMFDDNFDDGVSLFDSGTPLLLNAFTSSIINNTTPSVDISKALNWTATGLLSEKSINEGSRPIEVPIFKR